MKNINKKAFSLIEISIVILIIGVILAGITSSSRLLTEFRVNTAKNLTKNTSIITIDDMMLWYETVSDLSFEEGIDDSDLVDLWKDLNPTTSSKNNATQSTAGDKPRYVKNCYNDLPCLRFGFDSDAKYLYFDGLPLVESSYTLVFVEKRTSNASGNFFLGGTGAQSTNIKLHYGYESNTSLKCAQIGNSSSISVSGYAASDNPVINILKFDSSDGKLFRRNGQTISHANDAGSDNVELAGYPSAAIGVFDLVGKHYTGDLFEVIMFTRDLKLSEIQEIEEYLAKKWQIDI